MDARSDWRVAAATCWKDASVRCGRRTLDGRTIWCSPGSPATRESPRKVVLRGSTATAGRRLRRTPACGDHSRAAWARPASVFGFQLGNRLIRLDEHLREDPAVASVPMDLASLRAPAGRGPLTVRVCRQGLSATGHTSQAAPGHPAGGARMLADPGVLRVPFPAFLPASGPRDLACLGVRLCLRTRRWLRFGRRRDGERRPASV